MPPQLVLFLQRCTDPEFLKKCIAMPVYLAKWLLVFLTVMAVVVLFVLGVAWQQSTKVTADCGPTATMPLAVRSVDRLEHIGTVLKGLSDGKITPMDAFRLVEGMNDMAHLFWSAFSNPANGKPEGTVTRALKEEARQNQAAALAACCVKFNVLPTPPSAGGGSGGGQPWDPKNDSLTGAPLAAAALRSAGFPEAQIPMGVAVARYESTFNPHPATNPAMRGEWQINWAAHPELHTLGNAYDPYVNAQMAYSVWDAADGKRGNGAGSWSPWSTARTAATHTAEFASLSNRPTPTDPSTQGTPPSVLDSTPTQITPPAGCPLPTGQTLTGSVPQSVSGMVAELNPSGAGNWQGAVFTGGYWYVNEAQDAQNRTVIHRLTTAGVEVDSQTVQGAEHATSFAVIGTTVYSSFGNCHGLGCAQVDPKAPIRSFTYRGGTSITRAQTASTPWQGQIAVDMTGTVAVIRQGNRYRKYLLATQAQLGATVVTPGGQRQGFSVKGDALYVLTGVTNRAARVDTYSFATGRLVASKDVTTVGFNAGESGMREPEGMYSDMLGVKVFTGIARRLRIYQLTTALSATTRTPSTFGNDGNPRTVDQAMAWLQRMAVSRTHTPVNSCAHQVAVAYGWTAGGGTPTALSLWGSEPAGVRHADLSDPPRGALVFWRTSNPAGHVAVSAGSGHVYTTDAPGAKGRITLVLISTIDRWGPRLGWSEPYWPAHHQGVAA